MGVEAAGSAAAAADPPPPGEHRGMLRGTGASSQNVPVPASWKAGAVAGGAAVCATAALAATDGLIFDDVLTGFVIATFWTCGMAARGLRPESRAALMLMLAGVAGEWFIVASVVARVHPSPWWDLVARVLQCLAFVAWLGMMAIYPDGHPDTAARVTVGVCGALAIVLPTWALVADEGRPVPLPGAYQILFAAPVLGLWLLVRTYRRRGPRQRRQLRWVLLGMASAAVFYAFSATPLNAVLPSAVDAALFAVVTAFVAVSAAIGLTSPELVDVDLVIRRFPVYALLWLLIATMYAVATASLSVGAAQHLPVQWAVVLTVTSAMLFQPARARLERLADRAVFGRRLDGYDVLRELGASLEASTHLDEVGQVITSAVRASVDASWVRLQSVDEPGRQPHAIYGLAGTVAGNAELAVSVVHADTDVGVLECGPRRSGAYTEADREVVRTVARQAALAVLNLQRAAQISQSRRRIVEAADTERTRIERDLHDGVQQHLIALMAAIETARHTKDPARVSASLNAARDIGQGAVVELRSVIGGILPPVLADGGLIAAVRARAGQLPVPVTVEVGDGAEARFKREVEIAAYFFISETLVNVVRHAAAANACVEVEVSGDRLNLNVADDGRGMAQGVRWRGLEGLQDRFAALGGGIRVDQPSGRGTRVHGELPL